jgi:hypothetical protein
MMGLVNKTDKLDAHGLNTLQRSWYVADSLDYTGPIARPAGVDPRAHGVGRTADAVEETDQLDTRQVRTARRGLQ